MSDGCGTRSDRGRIALAGVSHTPAVLELARAWSAADPCAPLQATGDTDGDAGDTLWCSLMSRSRCRWACVPPEVPAFRAGKSETPAHVETTSCKPQALVVAKIGTRSLRSELLRLMAVAKAAQKSVWSSQPAAVDTFR